MNPIPYNWQYLPLLMQICVAFLMGVAMVTASWFIGRHRNTKVKLAAYECGIEAVGDARARFSVRYYLVAILFIIFDLEVAFLFPWAITLGSLGMFGFWSMMVFLAVLTVGFVYEWKKGALEWE